MNRSFSNTPKGERQCKQTEQNMQREVKPSCISEEQQESEVAGMLEGKEV